MNYYRQTPEQALKALKTSPKGLTEAEAEKRLQKYGPNQLKKKKPENPFFIFARQFTSPLIYILLIGLTFTIVIGEFTDAIIISAVIIINSILGFSQEYKAEKSIQALKKLQTQHAVVIREGHEKEIDAKLLVPGDIIILEQGSKIPADSRLIEVFSLETHESALTGESSSVQKTASKISPEKPLADQLNMAFSGTSVTKGRAIAVVTATGMSTEIGSIADMMQDYHQEKTPLQKSISQFSTYLGIAVISICLIVFLIGIIRGYSLSVMFMSAIALAVAAIPEGLPAVVTITLALGVTKLLKRKALIRKLHSVETLGCTNIICTDKTGTITQDQMTVTEIYTNSKKIRVTGQGHSLKGHFLDSKPEDYQLLLSSAVLCNNAVLENENHLGDPTEIAILVCGAKAGLLRENLEHESPREYEYPFDSETKSMTTINRHGSSLFAYTKGSPLKILNKCTGYYENGKTISLNPQKRKQLLEINKEMASRAMRVLAVAYKRAESAKQGRQSLEKEMVFLGFIGMIDPPREEIKQSIETCRKAGIRTIMLTGDQPATAKAIGMQIGLIDQRSRVVSGNELSSVSDKELDKIVSETNIFARISPKDKIRIVDSLKKQGNVVAMTGDGVNDVPALKKADIGIAMGITGTDVSKEASDMILLDDNFATIVSAVEHGRTIYSNIKKAIIYLLSSNLGEILVILFGMIIGLPLPLLAIHILWINLATDGFPALALSVEPSEPGIMEQEPRKKSGKLLSRPTISRMAFVGIIMCIGTLLLFSAGLASKQEISTEIKEGEHTEQWSYYGSYTEFSSMHQASPQEHAYQKKEELLKYPRTLAFMVLVMFQLFNVINCRLVKHSAFRIGFLTNKYMIAAIAFSAMLQLAILYTPLASYFSIVPLTLLDWAYVILVSSTVLILVEILKLVSRLKENKEIIDVCFCNH